MLFTRLTVWGGFVSLRSESPGKRPLQYGSGRVKRLFRWAAWVVLGTTALGIAGCATIGADSSPERKQKVVAERAQARWNLLLKGDLGGAYEFLSTGSKATTPMDLYKAKMKPGIWREAKLGKIDCEAEICKVVMLITYDQKRIKGIETPVDETWIIENGSAWYIYR